MDAFGVLKRDYIEHQSANFAQELLPLIFEFTIFPVESAIQEDQLHEALRYILHFIKAVEPIQHPLKLA